MARRNVLHGASAWEREEKSNQQRDYAAKLQEQVLQKQAKQEQEKARKQQEQREELEMLERERASATRKHHPQQGEAASDPPPPTQSPQRAGFMPHVPVVDTHLQGTQLTSPLKATAAGVGLGTSATDNNYTLEFTPTGSEPYTSTFSSSPSIFESILREPGIGTRSIAFYEDLGTLHRLTAELDLAAKQRHTKAQSSYIKPNFFQQEEISPPPLSGACSPVKFGSDKTSVENNQHEKYPAVHQQRIQAKSSVDGLQGESVLLPLGTAMPLTGYHQPKAVLKPQTESPVRQFATVATVEDEAEGEALDNYSEMMRFTSTNSEC